MRSTERVRELKRRRRELEKDLKRVNRRIRLLEGWRIVAWVLVGLTIVTLIVQDMVIARLRRKMRWLDNTCLKALRRADRAEAQLRRLGHQPPAPPVSNERIKRMFGNGGRS